MQGLRFRKKGWERRGCEIFLLSSPGRNPSNVGNQEQGWREAAKMCLLNRGHLLNAGCLWPKSASGECNLMRVVSADAEAGQRQGQFPGRGLCGWLHQALCLQSFFHSTQSSAATTLKFSIFEQSALHSHFALGLWMLFNSTGHHALSRIALGREQASIPLLLPMPVTRPMAPQSGACHLSTWVTVKPLTPGILLPISHWNWSDNLELPRITKSWDCWGMPPSSVETSQIA